MLLQVQGGVREADLLVDMKTPSIEVAQVIALRAEKETVANLRLSHQKADSQDRVSPRIAPPHSSPTSPGKIAETANLLFLREAGWGRILDP